MTHILAQVLYSQSLLSQPVPKLATVTFYMACESEWLYILKKLKTNSTQPYLVTHENPIGAWETAHHAFIYSIHGCSDSEWAAFRCFQQRLYGPQCLRSLPFASSLEMLAHP